jgi:hypothetical protein
MEGARLDRRFVWTAAAIAATIVTVRSGVLALGVILLSGQGLQRLGIRCYERRTLPADVWFGIVRISIASQLVTASPVNG